MAYDIRIKRVYDPPVATDGFRILVDRVWPRGMSKDRLQADLWLKEIAPSSALRKWFGHDRSKWAVFKSRYFAELEANEATPALVKIATKRSVTLLYSARDIKCNQAVALMEYIVNKLRSAFA